MRAYVIQVRRVGRAFVTAACATESFGLRLNSVEFVVVLKWWLVCIVRSCGESLNSFGDHLLCCKLGGFYQRNNVIRNVLWHLCQAAGIRATPEVNWRTGNIFSKFARIFSEFVGW